MARKAKERPPLPALEDGALAGHGWLLAMRDLADAGDERAAAALRRSQTTRPDLWDAHRMTPGDQAHESWLLLYGGGGPESEWARTALRHDTDRLRDELLAGSSDPLDRLMVDRILCSHLAANYHAALYAQSAKTGAGTTWRALEWHAARRGDADRAFFRACESFARVKRLRGPALSVNVGTVNVGTIPAGQADAALPDPAAGGVIDGAWRPASPVPEEVRQPRGTPRTDRR